MGIIKSVADLKSLRSSIQEANQKAIIENNNVKPIEINVAMATCGIASGAKKSLIS